MKEYQVVYDRPAGLQGEGYSALVRDEPGAHALARIAAMCRRWRVGATVREWGPSRFRVGRYDAEGVLTRAKDTDSETRAFYEETQKQRKVYEKRQETSRLAAEESQRAERAQREKQAKGRGSH